MSGTYRDGSIYGRGAMGISCAGGCGTIHRMGRRTIRGKGSNIKVTKTYVITGWTCPRCCNKSRIALAKAKAKREAQRQRLIEDLARAKTNADSDIEQIEDRLEELR